MFFALSNNFIVLVLARFYGGLFGGSMVVANAYITDVFPPKERGPKFAQLGATMMLALLIGPLSGAGLVALFGGSLRAPLIAATGLATIAFALASHYIVEPEDLRVAAAEPDKSQAESEALLAAASDVKLGDAPPEKDEKDASHNPWMSRFNLAIGCQTFCTTMSFNGLTSCIAVLLMAEKYGFVQSDGTTDQARMSLQIGLNTILISIAAMPTMIALFPKLLARFGILVVGTVGTSLFGACIFSLPFTPSIEVLIVLMPLIGIANGLQMNVSTISLSANAKKGHIAETLAVGTTCDAVAAIIGPFITQLFVVGLEVPFMIAGGAAWFGVSSAKQACNSPNVAISVPVALLFGPCDVH